MLLLLLSWLHSPKQLTPRPTGSMCFRNRLRADDTHPPATPSSCWHTGACVNAAKPSRRWTLPRLCAASTPHPRHPLAHSLGTVEARNRRGPLHQRKAKTPPPRSQSTESSSACPSFPCTAAPPWYSHATPHQDSLQCCFATTKERPKCPAPAPPAVWSIQNAPNLACTVVQGAAWAIPGLVFASRSPSRAKDGNCVPLTAVYFCSPPVSGWDALSDLDFLSCHDTRRRRAKTSMMVGSELADTAVIPQIHSAEVFRSVALMCEEFSSNFGLDRRLDPAPRGEAPWC